MHKYNIVYCLYGCIYSIIQYVYCVCLQVYKLLRQQGHNVVAVFTVPDDIQTGRPDPLAEQAVSDGLPVLKYNRWRKKKVSIPEVWAYIVHTYNITSSLPPSLPQVLEEYKSFNADLNVLPFCTQFIPMDVINFPKHGSIIYHPSLLPKHRGASAINWSATHTIKTRFSLPSLPPFLPLSYPSIDLFPQDTDGW